MAWVDREELVMEMEQRVPLIDDPSGEPDATVPDVPSSWRAWTTVATHDDGTVTVAPWPVEDASAGS